MSSTYPFRAVLMSADIKSDGTGFHKLVFKVSSGRTHMALVTVMISQDAHRKLATQMVRARFRPVAIDLLLKTWARWEIQQRVDDHGLPPRSVTITASDLDDFGAYATDLGRTLLAV
ncbi:MAG: hypothetical protein ACRDG3_04905 [Tepidiformaceae bacterium]